MVAASQALCEKPVAFGAKFTVHAFLLICVSFAQLWLLRQGFLAVGESEVRVCQPLSKEASF